MKERKTNSSDVFLIVGEFMSQKDLTTFSRCKIDLLVRIEGRIYVDIAKALSSDDPKIRALCRKLFPELKQSH